ncbi:MULTISPECIES: molecular chaperone [unclassified Lysinibacillus]|uniref:molecular chaperone n=1 Tax=unclassified Lysinibacillus TaxID=2636778 RepID=UPI0036E9AD68
MGRINRLLNLIECIDDLLTGRMEYEQMQVKATFSTQLLKAHQRVSLAEKKYYVKNACSSESSENN